MPKITITNRVTAAAQCAMQTTGLALSGRRRPTA
jgi:hypothetical protein